MKVCKTSPVRTNQVLHYAVRLVRVGQCLPCAGRIRLGSLVSRVLDIVIPKVDRYMCLLSHLIMVAETPTSSSCSQLQQQPGPRLGDTSIEHLRMYLTYAIMAK